jgi:hypothetical protein
MPYGSPITSLIGQEQAGNSVLGQAGSGTAPVYGYGELSPASARQNPPLPETVNLPKEDRMLVPTRVSLPPRLRVSTKGRGPILQTSQLWEGTIREVRPGEFVATLSDRTNPSNPDEQAVFDFREISPEDHELAHPGSTFYWVIGREITIGGQLKNVSFLQFRRLPAWTNRALARAAERSRHVRQVFRAFE